MTVLNPSETEHSIKLIPRYTPSEALTFITYNEATQESSTIANTYVLSNGFLTLSFTLSISDGDKLQFEIQEGESVVYRGKIFATSQEPQDYKLTNGLFYYE